MNRPAYILRIAHLTDSLDRYAQDGVPCGSFLTACLRNDLMDATSRGDERNALLLREICLYIYNEMPSACHGSREIVDAWVKKHTLERRAPEPDEVCKEIER